MSNTGHFILVILFLFSFGLAGAQVKTEREYRLKEDQVPSLARDFISSLGTPTKLRWYREESQEGSSVEAKFLLNRKKYSIEFDTTGHLQDVEFIIPAGRIPSPALERLRAGLDSHFASWKFSKVQQHHQGEPYLQRLVILKDVIQSGIDLFYEVEVRGKRNGVAGLYEIKAADDGKILEVKYILPKDADHLEY